MMCCKAPQWLVFANTIPKESPVGNDVHERCRVLLNHALSHSPACCGCELFYQVVNSIAGTCCAAFLLWKA